VPSSGQLERALGDAAQAVADKQGYRVSAHRFDQLGLCPDCH